jgi:hypothetical protein
VVNVGEAAIKFRNLALGLSPLAFLTMHSPVHFGLEDIRVSQESANLGPHPALKLWSREVRAPTLGNADLPPLAGAFVTVDAPAEVAYQPPAVFGAEFNEKFRPIWLDLHPGKSKISAGLSCGALHTVCKGIIQEDIVLSPDGRGSYMVGEIVGPFR